VSARRSRPSDIRAKKPTFFATPAAFREWLAEHHASTEELLVGFRKRATGEPSLTWPQSVDEALCFGWIDGVRHRLDASSYAIRFTPRKRASIWSAANVTRVKALEKSGRMTPAGRRAYREHKPARTGVYSFERDTPAQLTPAEEKALRAKRKAASFFDALPPSYRQKVLHWIVSAKQEKTRASRLARLIADCAAGRRW